MILISNIIFLAVLFITRTYKQWRTYYPTVLYVPAVNLFYNFLCMKKLPWHYEPLFLINHHMADIVTTLVLLPCLVMLYLRYFPVNKPAMIRYYLAWIAFMTFLEYVWSLVEVIKYDYGWNLIWSIAFYFIMFLVIRLHHTHTRWALLISIVVTGLLLYLFRIPFWK